MKTILPLLALCLMSFGCATAIPYSYDERCAFKNMKLSGVTSGDSTSTGAVFLPNGLIMPTSTDATSEQVSCVVPKTEQDRCEISRSIKIAEPKVEYNDGISGKRTVTGLGYTLFVAPGIIAKILYDKQRREALEQAKLANETQSDCGRIPASQ